MEAVKPKKKRKSKSKTSQKAEKKESTREVLQTSGASVSVLSQDETQTQDSATDPQARTDSEIQEPGIQSHTESKANEPATSIVVESHPLSGDQGAEVQTESGPKYEDQTTATERGDSECEEQTEVTDDVVRSKPLIIKEEGSSSMFKVESNPLVIKEETGSSTISEQDIVKGDDDDGCVSDNVTQDVIEGHQDAGVDGQTVQPALDQGVDLKIATPSDVIVSVPKIEVEQQADETMLSQVTTQSTNQIEDTAVEVEPSAPAQIDLTETVHLVCATDHEVRTDERMLYPRLDSIIQEQEFPEELSPFTEEDLAILYPNRQLDTNTVFVDNFLMHAQQENHKLYELLTVYLKAKQALASSQHQLESLKRDYSVHQSLLWKTEIKEVSSTGKCADGSKVSHTHSHKYGVYLQQHAIKVTSALKGVRELIHEELCMRSYSSQLARIHIDNYLFQVVHTYPELASFSGDAPVTSWMPSCPPGDLDPHTSDLRDCISVLFMFERKPVVDKEFSEDCRQWLDLLLSALLRIATLSDHHFLLNHLLRCPPGVGKWAVKYFHILSPLHTKQLLHIQYPHGVSSDPYAATTHTAFAYDWGVESGLHGNWGGPLVDHFVTMLATLLLPVKDRKAFLSMLELHPETAESANRPVTRMISQPWTFIEDSDEEDTEETHLLLKESDFIALFDQFSFTELFQHVLTGTMGEGDYQIELVSSYSVLRLFAFGTCLIRLLGAAFSTLKLARYKEFIKQVGRTIRQTVQYVADLWVLYKSHRLQCGDTPTSLPYEGSNGDPRYSLNRLQLEFDQFVLRATRWILTAHKLGAWQFLADMPYGSISLKAVWKIFWNIYCKQSVSSNALATSGIYDNKVEDEGMAREGREQSPSSVEEIREAIKDGHYKDQFVDHLMKTYTSEAVFLLTTLVNIARARPLDNHEEEEFISTIVVEIFECTQVVDYARDAYSRMGCSLLDSIAIVHPLIISTLMTRVESAVKVVGENCILLFKELSLHLWVPTSHDLHMIATWLVDSPLDSPESLLARVILTGLNWGTKSEDGSSELVLHWSTHCLVALAIVEAHSRHLPTHPGGRDYTPSTGIGKYASLHRFTTTTEQQEFVKWAWEIILMLKLHPNQVLTTSMRTLNPVHSGDPTSSLGASHEGVSNLSEPSWVRLAPGSDHVILPDLTSTAERELADLRDSVKYEGLLAYYVAMCITSVGSDTDHFLSSGLSMIHQLLTEGYYLPVLRVLANVTPRFFSHREVLIQEESFIQIVVAICNADVSNSSLRERWTYTTPSHLVTKKMAALIQTQLQGACGPTGIGGDKVLQFWIDILLACPNWYRERSVLHLLDTLCMAAHSEVAWQNALQTIMLKAYKDLAPIQVHKGFVSAMTSSLASFVVRQEGSGAPSIYNAIACSECPWLAYNALCAEQTFEEEQGVWKSLLKQLKKDEKATVETALKRAFSDLGLPGGFPSTHLCIFRWAEFAASIDHTHPLLPLVCQRFFMLYLQRPFLDSSMPDRGSQGIRFFASSRAMTLRRKMKTALSKTCKSIQANISSLETDTDLDGERRDVLRTFLPKTLSLFQTFRLWLEEPRLHSATLHLPSLPPQYDADRLQVVFQANKSLPWMDFVPLWEVKGQLNSLVEEWLEIATYQKTLGSKVQSHDASPETALTRLQERLKKNTTTVPPPLFVYINPPFTPLPTEVLVTREALLAVMKTDVQYMCARARSYCTKLSGISTLDDKYVTGTPKLYSNVPRQFHVRTPCHSRFNRSRQCSGPATIVLRIEEMTIEPRWEQELNVNRMEYDDLLSSLSSAVSPELCQLVMKMENTVSELSKLAAQSPDTYPNVPLQCGIALFYEMLGFIGHETRRYPPSCQVLTTCLQILGQEFVQRDPLQTSNILEQLLTQQGKADLLAPLFKPNLCPDQFLHMYGAAAEVAVKEGPSIAFSVLTKFNITLWLEDYDPGINDRCQLLQYISQGLCLCGTKPSKESEILVEVYRRHFVHLIEHKFPDQYNDALRLLINCTDNGSIAADTWCDLCTVIGSHDQLGGCKLGLKQIQDSVKVLTSNYIEKRTSSGSTVYTLLINGYVPLIGKFIRQLCLALVESWADAIAMDTIKHKEAVSGCWESLADVFKPWIETLSGETAPGQTAVLPPSRDGEGPAMREMMAIFVEVVTVAHNTLKDPTGSDSVMSHLWRYYCSTLSLPNTPPYIMAIYHATMEKLPWSTYFPDLAALDLMMKLKLVDHYPRSCFVFLGSVFPQFDWKRIAAGYHDAGSHDDPAMSVHFHIMLLQLLIMLAADNDVMNKPDTRLPEAMSDAQSFHWETVDTKTYQDILDWQKKNCDPCSILQTGSCLFLSLRLLKAAAGFPSESGPPEIWHNDAWEKRVAYIHLVVDLIGRSTHNPDTLTQSYTYALSHLFQIAVDICVNEYADSTDPHVVSVMQAILNLFSCCHSSSKVLDMLMEIVFDIVEQMPNAHLLTLPSIIASCRSIQSVRCIVQVIEHFIHCHFKAIPKPRATPSLELPKDPVNMYGWKSVVQALMMPVELLEEVCQNGISQCAGLTLHAHLLQALPQCTSIAQEGRVGAKIVGWCTQVKPQPTPLGEAKMFLLWDKAFGLLLRQVRFVGNFPEQVPHFSSLAVSMSRYGEDKASEGLLGAIGFGKKSPYSFEFRLISRAMAAYLYCQMPVDSSQTTQLRVIPNAPGQIKDPTKPTSASISSSLSIFHTKQGESAYNNFEHLMTNKHYSHLREHVIFTLDYIKDTTHSVMNCGQLLVHLCTAMYPDYRFLDLLRVLEV